MMMMMCKIYIMLHICILLYVMKGANIQEIFFCFCFVRVLSTIIKLYVMDKLTCQFTFEQNMFSYKYSYNEMTSFQYYWSITVISVLCIVCFWKAHCLYWKHNNNTVHPPYGMVHGNYSLGQCCKLSANRCGNR